MDLRPGLEHLELHPGGPPPADHSTSSTWACCVLLGLPLMATIFINFLHNLVSCCPSIIAEGWTAGKRVFLIKETALTGVPLWA